MTQRNPNRKLVDYSKFISQDSDDDDFSDHSYTRPTKKSKLSSSDKKTQNDTRSSKIIGQDIVAKNRHSNQNKVEATFLSGHFCPGKENANRPISSTLRASDKEISTVANATPNKKLTIIVREVNADDSKTSSNRSVEMKVKESNDNLQGCKEKKVNLKTNMKDDENKTVLKNNEKHASIQGKLCLNKDKCISDTTEVKCTANMPPTTAVVRQSVMPKWKAPGPSSSQNSIKLGNEGCSRSPMGLRLGLSRNTRVKPLHANVKYQL